jgi:uncharacterized cupin superfamily protein
MSEHAPPFIETIKNWREIERPDPLKHPHDGEEHGYVASFSHAFGFSRLGAHHHRLMPGQRTSVPHAERDEQEFLFVLEGAPDLWNDGHLHRLKRGHAVGWKEGTGLAHSLLNNTDKPVRMLVVGEASRYNSKFYFPRDRNRNAWAEKSGKLWAEHPIHKLGPHDGLTDLVRGGPAPSGSKKSTLPACAVHWQDIQGKDNNTYPGDKEKLAVGSNLSQHFQLSRLGLWVDELKPGRRTSYPHTHRDEEEFVYVLDGEPDVWINGYLYRLTAGDCVGWPNGTGQTHTVINNTQNPVRLIVVGEASRKNSNVFYPFHPKLKKIMKERFWESAPPQKMGPNDGRPDGLRKPKAKRKSGRNTPKRNRA